MRIYKDFKKKGAEGERKGQGRKVFIYNARITLPSERKGLKNNGRDPANRGTDFGKGMTGTVYC